MKACSKNRKRIAWLALDALEAREADALREHLARCEGCRRYFEEISTVAEGLAAARPDSTLEASEAFHRGVAEKLLAAEPNSVVESLAAWFRESALAWRVALPSIVVLIMALAALVALRRHPDSSPPVPPTVQIVSPAGSGSDLAPTIANYQMVASQSLDKLDELLTRQGNKRLPPAPVYTASSLGLGNLPF